MLQYLLLMAVNYMVKYFKELENPKDFYLDLVKTKSHSELLI